MNMIPIFDTLTRCRPSVRLLFSQSCLAEDPELLKACLDSAETLLPSYWEAERNFASSITFSKLIPFRYHFSKQKAHELIAQANRLMEVNLMTKESVILLKAGLGKVRLK